MHFRVSFLERARIPCNLRPAGLARRRRFRLLSLSLLGLRQLEVPTPIPTGVGPSFKNGGSLGSFAIRPAVSQEVCHSMESSRPHEARSCRVTCVLPLPAHWATSHEPLAGFRRCPSRPGPHPGARTRSRRPVLSLPLPVVARS